MRGVWLVVITACGYPKLPQLGDSIDAPSGKDAAMDGSGDHLFVPAHLMPGDAHPGAPDLLINGASNTIDTTNLTVNGAPSPFFVNIRGMAVLFTNEFQVQNPVVIVGSLPLLVAANDKIVIGANADLSGTVMANGPGGVSTGPGVGLPGKTLLVGTERESSGGGGGSYGTIGGPGGTSDAGNIPAGGSGMRYGMMPSDSLIGGSSGGSGGNSVVSGGGGGGALQLSSQVSIAISATINAGGGGGRGGGTGNNGGAGGGAGGEIFLESRAISLTGTLAANGGGGGGGGANGSVSASDGTNGAPGPGVAVGGTGGVPQGSTGGAGAAGVMGSFVDAKAGSGVNSKGGGGGGGAGRIWLRFPAGVTPDVANGRITPPADLDPTL